MEIEAKVAEVLDDSRIALNVGSDMEVEIGDRVRLWREVEIRDPEEHESLLGKLRLRKATLIVTQVYPRFCVAEVRTSSAITTFSFLTRETKIRSTSQKENEDTIRVDVGDEATVYLSEEDGGNEES